MKLFHIAQFKHLNHLLTNAQCFYRPPIDLCQLRIEFDFAHHDPYSDFLSSAFFQDQHCDYCRGGEC